MDTLSQDIWYCICNYLSTYDFVRSRQIARKYKDWSTGGWILRAADRLHLNADREFRSFFSQLQVLVHLQYLNTLAWGRIVEKYSTHVISPIDCLSFAITMRDVELVSYFAKRVLPTKNLSIDLFLDITYLCDKYRASVCYIKCLELVKTIMNPVVMVYDLSILAEYSEIDRNTIMGHLIRLKVSNPIITRMLTKYIKIGFDAITQVDKNDIRHFIYCGTPDEIRALPCINDEWKFSFVLASSIKRGRLVVENAEFDVRLEKDVHLSEQKFIPHMCRLWTNGKKETKIPDYPKLMFSHIYVDDIPTILHICGLCSHFCKDGKHRCNHTLDEKSAAESQGWYVDE